MEEAKQEPEECGELQRSFGFRVYFSSNFTSIPLMEMNYFTNLFFLLDVFGCVNVKKKFISLFGDMVQRLLMLLEVVLLV